jgi:DUF1680 family protein
VGDPCKKGNIETCCVVAYNALAWEVFCLTGDLRVIDFLERAHYNAVLGYYSPTGRWSTYHTPMEGVKEANFHTIGFQCRAGSPELNCCSVNAPRGVATVREWMVTEDGESLYINFYGDAEVVTDRGEKISISGGYPAYGNVTLSFENVDRPVKLRIPSWANATVCINGKTYTPENGKYFALPSMVNSVNIDFGFAPYFEKGSGDFAGRSSVYVGPVLYGVDASDNCLDGECVNAFSEDEIRKALPERKSDGSIRIVLPNGRVLKDFYHLGLSGSWYTTWLNVE